MTNRWGTAQMKEGQMATRKRDKESNSQELPDHRSDYLERLIRPPTS
ncbi:hypothetical protein Vi05172_g3051 [Venturia inaequalis]|nr:hypothetical protein Vi05172_g3051 [Venturia inaequalis]